MKICTKCNIEKHKKEFGKDKQNKDELCSQCKDCRNESQRKSSKKYHSSSNGKYITANGKLKLRYGITLEEYNKMFKDQNGECRICGTKENRNKRFSVDHDHETRKVRGLLCFECNKGLGGFRDNTIFLMQAIKYLNREHL